MKYNASIKILPDIFQKGSLRNWSRSTVLFKNTNQKLRNNTGIFWLVITLWRRNRYKQGYKARAKSHLIIRWIILIILSTIVRYGYLLDTCCWERTKLHDLTKLLPHNLRWLYQIVISYSATKAIHRIVLKSGKKITKKYILLDIFF